jgi:hypothetical protein
MSGRCLRLAYRGPKRNSFLAGASGYRTPCFYWLSGVVFSYPFCARSRWIVARLTPSTLAAFLWLISPLWHERADPLPTSIAIVAQSFGSPGSPALPQTREASNRLTYLPTDSGAPAPKRRAIQTLVEVVQDLDDQDLRIVLDLARHLLNRQSK